MLIFCQLSCDLITFSKVIWKLRQIQSSDNFLNCDPWIKSDRNCIHNSCDVSNFLGTRSHFQRSSESWDRFNLLRQFPKWCGAVQSFRLSLFYGAAAVKDIYGTDIRKWSPTGDLLNLTHQTLLDLIKICLLVQHFFRKERKAVFQFKIWWFSW